MLREASGGHERDLRYVWYAVSHVDLDPDEITGLTGLPPDQAWKAGDPKPRTGLPRSEGAWILQSGLNESDEFHDHLDALLTRMRSAWEAFVELGVRYQADVGVAIYLLDAQGPLIQVLPDVSASIAELNAILGFDLYAIPEEEEEGDRSDD